MADDEVQVNFLAPPHWRAEIDRLAKSFGVPARSLWLAAIDQLLKRADAEQIAETFDAAKRKNSGVLDGIKPGEFGLAGERREPAQGEGVADDRTAAAATVKAHVQRRRRHAGRKSAKSAG